MTHPGITVPLLMKIPRVSEGEDPAAIVSFEMEQMILPRISGPHVPACFGTGDFAHQAYVVIERIPGDTLYKRLSELPLPYEEARGIVAKIASALADLHRQNVIHHDIKPSSIMFRDSGEAVLIDYGLSHHNQLPDLLQEEFRLPYGTAPYMAPERLLGVRDDPRSDLFSLGVLLVFLHHRRAAVRRDRDLARHAAAAVARSASAAPAPVGLSALAAGNRAALPGNPAGVALSDGVATGLRSHPSRSGQAHHALRAAQARSHQHGVAPPLQSRTDASEAQGRHGGADRREPDRRRRPRYHGEAAALNEALRVTAERILATLPSARLACLNVLKLGRVTIDRTLDEQGNNKHIDRMVALKHWASPLKLDESRLTVHVLEAVDPASAILEFAEANEVDHLIVGARQDSVLRTLLGSVSARVAAEATCTVTVVRPQRLAELGKPDGAAAAAPDTVVSEAHPSI